MADGSRTARDRGRRRGRRGRARGQGRGAGARRQGRERRHAAGQRQSAQAKADKASKKSQWAEFIVDVWITHLQLGRVRHLQAQPQPRQVAPVHHRHGYLRRGDRERRAHRPARLSRGPVAQEHRHGQAPGVQALQRDGELARHHGPDDRPQPAADARRARPAGDVLLHQRRRPRQHGLPRALGQQVAAAAGELLVLPAGGRQAAVLPPAPRLHRSRRRLHALQSAQPGDRLARRQGVLDRRQVEGPGQGRARRPAPA